VKERSTHAFAARGFRFGVGIEDTFVVEEAAGRRRLDEYALTQHYAHWTKDLDLVKQSGATTIRYGFPWYRLNPAPGTFEWDWADRVVEHLCELELEVIVDLVHYGTPLWLDNHFLNRGYPDAVAEYAFALAERYGDRLEAWTPLNEPQWTARRCGESGIWPPYFRGHDGYLQMMKAICTGIVKSQEAISDATSGRAAFVHVEASFRYDQVDDTDSEEAALLAERRFLSGDLLSGAVGGEHPLVTYLTSNGFTDDDLAWFHEHPALPDVVGINYYPMWSTIEYFRDGDRTESRERDDGVAGLEALLREFSSRYGRPVMVTETSFEGTIDEQVAWLNDVVDLLTRLRAEIHLAGFVWWPFLDQIKWQYREANDPLESHLHRLGLVSLRPTDVGELERRPNKVFDAFRELSSSGLAPKRGSAAAGSGAGHPERADRLVAKNAQTMLVCAGPTGGRNA